MLPVKNYFKKHNIKLSKFWMDLIVLLNCILLNTTHNQLYSYFIDYKERINLKYKSPKKKRKKYSLKMLSI